MNKLLAVGIITIAYTHAMAQAPANDTTIQSSAINEAIAVYHTAADDQSFLYSGPQHTGYDHRIEGTPYFETGDWQKGTVSYDKAVFQNIMLLYDEVADKLIVQHPVTHYQIELIPERIASFSLAGHTFINVREGKKSSGLKTGFYDLLITGTITLLAKREKKIEELTQGTQAVKHIKESATFYALTGNTTSVITNRRSLFNLLKAHKKEVQQYLRKNKIQFRKNPENTIIKSVDYYNTLIH